MKNVIKSLLCVLLIFSIVTVSFAGDIIKTESKYFVAVEDKQGYVGVNKNTSLVSAYSFDTTSLNFFVQPKEGSSERATKLKVKLTYFKNGRRKTKSKTIKVKNGQAYVDCVIFGKQYNITLFEVKPNKDCKILVRAGD